MKIKPIYIYLGVFIVFVAAVLFFSETTKKSNMPSKDPLAQMPDDDIHGKMRSQGNGDMPSKSNLMNDAVEKINKLKSDYEKNPNDTAKVLLYADVLIAHQPEEAVKLYNKILKIDPKRVDVLLQMTYVSFNMGDVAKAEEYNARVLSINPNNLIAKFNTGGLAQAKGDNTKARSIWTDLSSRYPNSEVGKIAGELVKQLDQNATKSK
ncbi:MAG: tetratricopeptide repeat protein [Melioribacteraceae bacterium]